MSRLGRERLIESFAQKRKLKPASVSLVDATFRQDGADTEVILTAPLSGSTRIRGEIGNVMLNAGKDFVIKHFEMANHSRVTNAGRDWMMAVHNPGRNGEISATFLLGFAQQYRFGSL
ncbi:MAG TPA: hypothetical protein VL625_04905 [Patescibacteria group bacterium]|jgi:hypothetical protein|nr:hypothetical protein [Patescibacteria group bacterium]